MSKISESGYLFIHSGVLEKEQIEKSLLDSIKYLAENYNKDFHKTKYEINVVMNKEGVKYGHTYAWVDNKEVFHALLGLNFDGSERIEYYDDPDWKPPEKSHSEYFAEAMEAANDFDFDWAADWEEQQKYVCPQLKRQLDPLVSLPAVKYTPSQIKEIENQSEFGFMEVFPIKLSYKTGKLNSLFTNDIPEWVSEELLFKYFEKFEKDKTLHIDKKSNKKFRYPIVKIKSKRDIREMRRFGTITFSNTNKNTATFLINLVKRVEFKKGDNKALLFFSQSKSKN